jgi:hypothetical protein
LSVIAKRKKETFWWLICIACLFSLFLFRLDDIKGGLMESNEFIQVSGVILKSSNYYYSSGGRSGGGYKLSITYKYKFNEKTFTSDKYSFGQSLFNSKKEADSISNKYKMNQNVTVYVSQKEPDIAVLEPQINSNKDFIYLFLILLFVAAFLYRDMLKRWKREDKNFLNKLVKKKKRKKR